jgi:Bacterial PH domain
MRMASADQFALPASVNRYLLPWERSVITVRMHPAALIGPGLAASGGVAAAWKLARDSDRPDIVWGASLLVLLDCARRMAAWPVTYLVITNERVLIIGGLLTRTVTSVSLDEVQGLTFRRTVLGRLLGYGSLAAIPARRGQAARLARYLPYPEQLYLEITSLLSPGERAPDEEDSSPM